MSHIYSVATIGPGIFYLTALTGGWLPAFTAAAELLSINYVFSASNWILPVANYPLFLYAITFFGIGLFSILFHIFAIPGVQNPFHSHIDRRTHFYYFLFFGVELFGIPFAMEAVLPSLPLMNPWASFLIGIGIDIISILLLAGGLFAHTKQWDRMRANYGVERQLIHVGSVFHEKKQVFPTMMCLLGIGLFMRASAFFGMIQGPGQTQNADLYVGLAQGCMIVLLGPAAWFILHYFGWHGKSVMEKFKKTLHSIFPPLNEGSQEDESESSLLGKKASYNDEYETPSYLNRKENYNDEYEMPPRKKES